MKAVQASGENVLAALHKFTDVLGSRQEDLLGENNVFFDILGCIMASIAAFTLLQKPSLTFDNFTSKNPTCALFPACIIARRALGLCKLLNISAYILQLWASHVARYAL